MTRDQHFLEDILAAVDTVFFGERLHDDGVTIRWKRWRKTKNVSRVGCYWPCSKLIEVSRLYQLEWVPLHAVVSLVYHEGLHHTLGPEHNDAFRIAEQRDPNFAVSEAWFEDNLERLLAARPPRSGV